LFLHARRVSRARIHSRVPIRQSSRAGVGIAMRTGPETRQRLANAPRVWARSPQKSNPACSPLKMTGLSFPIQAARRLPLRILVLAGTFHRPLGRNPDG
jgi:hypothetical protein